MRPSSGETMSSSFGIPREAVGDGASWPSGHSIDASSVERYRGNRYQAQDENALPISEASRARRDQELSPTFSQGFSSPFTAPQLQDSGLHFSHSNNNSPGSWGISDGRKDSNTFEREVSKDSLDLSSIPPETPPSPPTSSRQRSNSYRNFGSLSSGDLSPIYEGKGNIFTSTPKQSPERFVTRSTAHPDELHQAPRDIPKGKQISESPESPGGDIFHFSPEGDSYNPLVTYNPIHTKDSPLDESPSMQRKKQLDTMLYKDSEIPAGTRDGFESYGFADFSALENGEPRYRQHSSTPESNSSSEQHLAWDAVLGRRHPTIGPSHRASDSPPRPGVDCWKTVKGPNSSTGRVGAKLYASMELRNDPSQEQERSAVYPTSKQDLGHRPSMNEGNTAMSNRTSVKAHHHPQLQDPDRPGFQASPYTLSPGKGKYYPYPDTKTVNNPSSNKIAVAEFAPNFIDKTEKHSNLRSEIERILNEPDNPIIRGSPLVADPDMKAENSTLAASLSSAPSDALQEAFDFLSAQVEALLQEKSGGGGLWSKHFPITNAGTIQYIPKDTKTYAFEDCSNLQKLIRCTAVFLDTLTGASYSGFWAEPDLFITSLRFREQSANGHVMDYKLDMAPENSRYFVSPSNTGMLEDRVPVLLKAWDTPSNLAIFQPVCGGQSQQYSYEHIGIENLVEDHELLSAYSNQIYSDDNIAAIGYIHARPKLQEGTEPDDLRSRTSCLGFNSGKDTRIRTVCSINQVRRFIEGSEHTKGVLKADCLFPQNFYGSPCIVKQSGFVIGVVNGPHSVSNTGDIKLFPQGFKKKLRWFACRAGFVKQASL